MVFLAVMIALVLLQVWGSGGPVQNDEWLYRWQKKVAGWSLAGGVKLLVLVAAPVILVLLLLHLTEQFLFGLPWIALAAALLLYAFGRGDFQAQMEHYRTQVRSGDFQGAALRAVADLDLDPGAVSDVSSPREMHQIMQRYFLYSGYQHWFAVLFYFVLLGPAGALAYRLLQLSRHTFEPVQVERALAVADWLPARLLAATFSLAGDFVRSRDRLLQALGDSRADVTELLYSVAEAALGGDVALPADEAVLGAAAAAQNGELGALLSRSAICWIAVFAVVVVLL